MPASSKAYSIVGGWPSINIGMLRHRIAIQSEVDTGQYDAAGKKMSWQDFIPSAMAAIETVRGTDVIRAGQNTAQLYLTITIPYQRDFNGNPIQANMRVIGPTGSTYLIQAIENILEMGVVLVLNCIGLGLNQ
jgi:SPP1 family predicted phage head-tail adaptor